VLDGIILALSNTGLDDPIRHGRPAASVKLTLGTDKAEYLLERKITKKGSYLTLTDANGIPVQKAQTFLNGLLGNYAFDPLEFTRLKPKAQVEALKTAAGLDFTELDAKRAGHYAERTAAGRDGKEAVAQLAAVPEPALDVPTEELSAAELMETLRGMEEKVRAVSAADADYVTMKATYGQAIDAVARLTEQLEGAKRAQREMSETLEKKRTLLETTVTSAPTDADLAAAKEAISKVDETNRAVRQARKHGELTARVKKLRAEYATLDRRIEEIDLAKSNAIKDANLPLDGLELTDEGVLMNGVFFSQLSTAEQIRVSALVAMSQNPNLKIVIVREGALMNSSNLKVLSELAAERGFQVWMEVMRESPGTEGLHIIDGQIAFVDGEAV
jgi:hypothetical protein